MSKTTRTFTQLAVLLFASAIPLAAQGPLSPPGPPAPTMKTLDQVEARTPVNAATAPGDANHEFIISQPGSYYLTGNVVTAKTNGLRITAPGVTLDLNGFHVRRASGTGGYGIEVFASRCAVRNGSISGFGTGLIGQVDAGGVSRVGELTLLTISQCGRAVAVNHDWRIDRCTAVDNTEYGMQAGDGATFVNCIARRNNAVGIQAGNGSVVKDCTASDNRGQGIFAGRDSKVEGCVAVGNDGSGIAVDNKSVVRACVADGNGALGYGGAGDGFNCRQRAVVIACKANDNRDFGIFAEGDSVIVDNHVSLNGQRSPTGPRAGIRVTGAGSRIEGNHARDTNGIGIHATTADVIIRNTAGANSEGNFVPASGANVGPVSTGVTGATHPLANVQF